MDEPLPPLLGEDPLFLDTVERASRLAAIDRPCLVVGERGTGKELFTSRLHYLSPRWNGPLAKVNCAALSETLLESELFGHEAGAFTGAQQRRAGYFEHADGGTLILDEIADASLAVQSKVLRVIEYGEFQRVGGSATLRADVRVIAATNVDLPALAAGHRFRADLLDRLAFDVLTLPPLRARHGDILQLAEAFAVQVSQALDLDAFPGFSAQARRALLAHDWPGNVRELRNAVERSVFAAASTGGMVEALVIDPFESPWRPPVRAGATTGATTGTRNAAPPAPAPGGGFSDCIAAYERQLLASALRAARHNQTAAARHLDLGYHQFRRLLKKHALASPNNAAGTA